MVTPLTPRKRLSVEATLLTQEKAEAAKRYIESKYSFLKAKGTQRKADFLELDRRMEALELSQTEKDLLKQEILHHEAEQMRLDRRALTPLDFEPIAIIGKGAFGEVRVVRHVETGEILAMKKMSKTEMQRKNQVQHVRAERDVLAKASNPWIVQLKYSFQDESHLYLGMEYLPGGDLMTLLMRKDVLSESEARFYMAESVLAIECVHQLHYIHRDIKPDNILLDHLGHVKLSDFGLCKHTQIPVVDMYMLEEEQEDYLETSGPFKRNRVLAYTTVGTPDYIAPEIFSKQGYTQTVDWWSIGVILFEMVVGYPPFYSDDPQTTCQKILHWKKSLKIPKEAQLSRSTSDLIKKLICDAEERLGNNGAEEIKRHPFFMGVDWDGIRNSRAPNVPQLSGETDTSNFDQFEEDEPFHSQPTSRRPRRKDVTFAGYTFKGDTAQRARLKTALEDLEKLRQSKSHPDCFPVENTDKSTSQRTTN